MRGAGPARRGANEQVLCLVASGWCLAAAFPDQDWGGSHFCKEEDMAVVVLQSWELFPLWMKTDTHIQTYTD